MGETKRAKRVTMSQARKQAIYNAVYEPFMAARVQAARTLAMKPRMAGEIDEILYVAQCNAASDAVRAAEGYSHG